MKNDMLHWEASEFEYKEKSSDWYWILGIVAVVGALISVFLNNVLFAIFILLGAFLMAMFASKHPEIIQIKLNYRGILVNETLYPYRSINSFWVEDFREGKEKLLITPRATFALQVVLPIRNIDPDLIREFMATYCQEEEQRETIAERIMEYFHF